MHLITSNFNLLESNSHWNNLKKKKFEIEKNFNYFFFRINNNLTFSKYETIHVILNYDNFSKNEILKKIKILKENKNLHKVIFYFFLNCTQKIYLKETKILKKKIKSINCKNFFLYFFKNNSKIKFSKRNQNIISFPFEINTIKEISNILISKIKVLRDNPYKLIILDCDNTLWKGVLDEEGLKNINYSNKGKNKVFYEFQNFLKSLKKKGFILSISSKNDEHKVWKAMKHKKMILQKKDFILPKINWLEKKENIQQTLKDLSLRAEDTLFIDDSLIELTKVKDGIKKINILHFEKKNILSKIEKNYRLKKNIILKEDKKKYHQYKLKSKFIESKKKNKTNNLKFIKSLKQEIKIIKINKFNIKRALQLFQKTNQFNFALNRYDLLNLSSKLKDRKFSIRLINFSDKFGNHGLVGLFAVKNEAKKVLIKDFLLSCRVLFRKIEDYIIFLISKENNKKNIIIEYNQTSLNNKLIPIFLNNSYFRKFKTIKNKKFYLIKPNKLLNESEKLFIRRT